MIILIDKIMNTYLANHNILLHYNKAKDFLVINKNFKVMK
jgi:hypothetical protein